MLTSVSAGLIHSPAISMLKPGVRCGNAVSVGAGRVAAPWKCSSRSPLIGDGQAAKRAIMVSMASSLNADRKFAFQ